MSVERLTEYGSRLVEAGFEVWLIRTPSRHGGYIQYRDPATGMWGSLQYSDYQGWQHLMPIKPSVKHGSSMFISRPVEDVWTVEAARQCASPSNYNVYVGVQANAGRWSVSQSAVALHETA